jgi:uncharacterized protein
MMRLLYFAVLIWLAYKLVKLIWKSSSPDQRQRTFPSAGGRVLGGELVQDPHCGVYVPKETAVKGRDGEHFCSEACRDAHQKKGR